MHANDLIPDPVSRTLRVFAFDPSLSGQIETATIGEISIDVPWEQELQPGPVGEYVEVVDADPASQVFYKPVDLNDPRILAQDGLAPSESNPQFHQQMTYAVAMSTIGHFERALGRVALWSTHRFYDRSSRRYVDQFVRRLRIYPHALRDRNAYYSPEKKALLFGYFPVGVRDASAAPGTLVFTCLSHDIIAHETTHALLDGVHPRFNEPANLDVLAFHEAFADIVALFQRFSYPGVLRDQIAKTRGNLASENLLAQLAQQFGRASGRGSALRDALGITDPVTGKWAARVPDVRALDTARAPHDRGAVLVAAVFGAFLSVYRARTQDLYRIASEGTGVLRAGEIHPDLSNRLADEAMRSANSVLQMCIRAIDYCPPVGITFGDYLRAIITADFDHYPEDTAGYRVAFVESFRQWGIYPSGMPNMSVEALVWPAGLAQAARRPSSKPWSDVVDPLFKKLPLSPWDLESDRFKAWQGVRANAWKLWKWLVQGEGRVLAPELGLVLDSAATPTVFLTAEGQPAVEVHSVRTARRRSTRGSLVTDLVIEITQRRRGYFDPAEQKRKDQPGTRFRPEDLGDFQYRAGCTVLLDLASRSIRYVIRTPGTIADDRALERQRQFLVEGGLAPHNPFDIPREALHAREPFALLHRDEPLT